MALVKCGECGHDVSNQAKTVPELRREDEKGCQPRANHHVGCLAVDIVLVLL